MSNKNDSIENLFKSSSKSERVGAGERTTDKRKQSLYFPETMLEEIKAEAVRLDRSLSWVVQRAWKLAKGEIAKIPTVTSEEDDEG